MTATPGPRAPLFRSVAGLFLTRVGLLPLGLLQGALLARALGPAGLGLYSALLTDVNLAVTVAAFGLPGALTVLIGERAGWLRQLLRFALGWGGAALLVPGIGLVLVATWTPAFAGVRLPIEVALCAVLALWQYGRDVLGSALTGTQQFRAQNWQALGIALLQLTLCAGLFMTARLDPHTAVGIQIISNVVLCLLAGMALRAVALEHGLWQQGAEPGLRRRALDIGRRNFLHILPDLLLLRIDVYLIQHLLSDGRHTLGIYQAGVRIAEMVLLLPGALNTVLFAKAAAREDVDAVTVASAKLSLYLGLVTLAGMALCGQPLLTLLYGERFSGSFVPCLLVLLGCATSCFASPLAGTLAGRGAYPPSIIVAQTLALLVNVGLNLLLIPRYGATGAALSTTLSYALSSTVITVAFARQARLPLWQVLRPESPLRLIRKVRAH